MHIAKFKTGIAMTLEDAIATRYPMLGEAGDTLRVRLLEVCHDHIESGLADGNSLQRLCSKDHWVFWQQFSEVLIGHQLKNIGLQPSHQSEGPDFLIEHEGIRTWIEVITPEPRGIPDSWTKHVTGEVGDFPHEKLLLRWTSAIKEKAEKLLGRVDRKSGAKISGYRDNGIVGETDKYVIAVNGRLLRGFGGVFPEINGISQLPFAVESTLAIGPLQIYIDRTTLKQLGSEHQHRSRIKKPKGAEVPADTFLDPLFAPVSAIWAVDLDESLVLGKNGPMVVVHNPLASAPVPSNMLPAQCEYFADVYDEYYELHREDGVLAE